MAKIKRATKGSIGREYACGECHRNILPGEAYYYWGTERPDDHIRCVEHRPDELEAELLLARETAEGGFRASTLRHIETAMELAGDENAQLKAELQQALQAVEGRGFPVAREHLERALGMHCQGLVTA